MIDNLYKTYLTLGRIQKAAARAGVDVYSMTVKKGDDTFRKYQYIGYGEDISVTLGTLFASTPEEREEQVVAFMEELPMLSIHRKSGRIHLFGLLSGLKVEVMCGEGVCERVQTGTRIVPATEEHEEPIFEVRCADPLRELVKS